ncbi:LptA/OstA family protein [Deferribacter abyssi]|uniref:LptA/OstA family protein n=1 Tax=Deferribacter abyssi TaxID=213806 RepID=UPI003C1C63CE
MKWLISLFVIFLFSFNIHASNAIKIKSDKLIYDGEKRESLFEGNVEAVYDNTTVNSDKMIVYINENNRPVKIICIGNVKVVRDNILSLSDRAEMDIIKDLTVLKGNVKIWQNKNYLEGDEVYIYNKEKRLEVKNIKDKKVKIIFYPDEKVK